LMAILRVKRLNVSWQNEKGFTLVEALIALMVFCILMAFLPLGIRTVLSDEYLNRRIQRLEWEVFNSQIKKEVRVSHQVTVQNNKLLLQKNGDTILYEKYGTNIRRRVNFSGHEILLQNVASVQFRTLPQGYSLEVIGTDGEEYETNVRAFIPIEVIE
jgi:competence protein ComGF